MLYEYVWESQQAIEIIDKKAVKVNFKHLHCERKTWGHFLAMST